jgi:hypothetical protein
MNTITELRESQETPTAKPPLGHLQAKIDLELFDRLRMVAARRHCHVRDVINELLTDYLPKAEAALAKPE